jgi:hypothetical protein
MGDLHFFPAYNLLPLFLSLFPDSAGRRKLRPKGEEVTGDQSIYFYPQTVINVTFH